MTFYKVSMVNLVTFLLTALCFFCRTSHGEDYSSCGIRSVHRGKIFGGLLSRPGMWPWQVAIFRKIRDERRRPRFLCGGALLNSRWVLSAAHCFHKRPHEEYVDYSYTVKAGEYEIDIKDPHDQERNAFRIHNHPNFVPRTYENDIALIELDKGVKMGPHVRSICLPKANEILTTSGEVVSVAGWGFTTKGSYSSVLLYSAFEIQTNKKCADTTRYLYNETVMFCAGQSKGGNDNCKGESGGSTVRQVLRDGRRRWVTVGLVSWGEECGIKGKYGYYTRMEPFVPWIQDKINGSSLSCGNPGSVRNGRIIGSEFLVGFTVKYICNEGYRMRGRSTRICRRNGKWTKAPTCLKVECRNPGTPRYGVRRPKRKKYYYKDKVRFRCKTNYTIVGRSAMRCRWDGTWSGFKPVCLAPCKDPGIPTGGIRLDHSFKHGQAVRFLCRKRDQPSSVSFLTCTNGKWNQNIPRCIADCDDPGSPTNGQRQGDDFTFNKRVYFTCDRGYMRVGPAYLQCQSNRRWNDNAPICQPLSCIRPKLPENAYIYGRGKLKEQYGFDEVVMFQCKKGYSASVSPFVRCLADGWSKTNLRCPPKNCGDPGHPANGRRQGYVFTFKSQVNFTCDRPGYELKGSPQRVCQENGRWSGTRTTCEPVECRDPGRLVNGDKYPEQNKYVFKDSIRFQCKTNYTIRGNRSITCQHDKRWSGNVPTCLAPCRDPGIPNNGRRLDHSFLHNARVRFSCQRRWNIDGAQSITCNNGNWDHPTPQCLEGCQRPKRPDNGGIYSEKDFYKHRQQIRYYCSNGYQRLGDEYSTCQNGKWTGQTPTCKRRCGDPGRPASGFVRGSTYYEGREVSFDCYRGYDLIGSRIARCLPTGQWSQPRPVCKRGCYAPQFANSIPNPLLRRGQKSLHGTSITFICRQQSHTLDGPSVIYCLNGQWSGRVPSCRASCSKPSDLAYGRITGQNYGHGQKLNFTCLGLYTLVGSSSITCNDGRWALDYLNQWPSCKNSCPNPGIPIKGSRSGSDYRHGKRISYTCERGTQMIGESSSTCNDGKWSSVRPSCLKICQDPGNIINGYKTETRRVYLSGDKATYRCNRGFDLAGRAELRCDDDGRWDHEVPVCYISCKDSGPIENGRKTSTNFTAKFKCDIGYSLEGPAFIKCVEGKWIPGPPQCPSKWFRIDSFFLLHAFRALLKYHLLRTFFVKSTGDCDDPGLPRNGMRNSTDFKHGKSVAFGCLNGFRLIGSTAITCNNGLWSNMTPRCKGVCPFLDAPQNGKRLGDNFDLGARVNFECDKGYSMDGPSILICNRNRHWSGNPPICKAPCSDPGHPRNGRRKGDNFVHRGTVKFFCDQEYEIFGAQNIRCNDGNWSHPVPACETGCLNLVIPRELTTSGNIGRSRSLISFSCTSPLSLIGKSILTCTNGRWSDYLPTCTECGSPLGMANGRIPDGNIQASSTRRRYRARDGRLNGPYAWCSGTERSPYLQVDFGKAYRITGLATQGSAYDNRWVERYTVSSNLAGSSFNTYREDNRDKIFDGNRDKGSTVKNKLRKPLIARRLRIHPQKQGGFSSLSPACMRVEIYGCDLPSDCLAVGSRVVAKWVQHHKGYYIYLKAYLTDIGFYWKVELENENHGRPAQNYVPKYTDLPFVLDVPPKHEELQVGTRVLAPWWFRWYTCTIKAGRNGYNKYLVMGDDGDQKELTIDQMRLLKAPIFC